MLVFLFPVYALAGEVRADAPTGGPTGMSPLPDPNPACGFECERVKGFMGVLQGL